MLLLMRSYGGPLPETTSFWREQSLPRVVLAARNEYKKKLTKAKKLLYMQLNICGIWDANKYIDLASTKYKDAFNHHVFMCVSFPVTMNVGIHRCGLTKQT
jgi:hypothetical protein